MTLTTYALLTEDELKKALSVDTSTKDELVQSVINRATARIEAFLGRELVTRGAVTEYYSPESDYECELYLSQFPTITVTSVKVDEGVIPRTYATTLVEGTDYGLNKAASRFTRINFYWPCGWRTVQVVASRGYATRDAVPDDIKAVAIRLAAVMWEQAIRPTGYGVSSLSDGAGSYTRFLPGDLSSDMKDALGTHRSLVNFCSAEVA